MPVISVSTHRLLLVWVINRSYLMDCYNSVHRVLRWTCLLLCLSVCLSVHPHISRLARTNFTKFSPYVAYGRGLILFQWRCDTLCTYDVIFAHNGNAKRTYNYVKDAHQAAVLNLSGVW